MNFRLILLGLALCGCGTTSTSTRDAGNNGDATHRVDAGNDADTPDGSTGDDGGPQVDAGTHDSGVDAGPPPNHGDYAPTFKQVSPMGYGTVRNLVVTQSAAGRTGQWWCDNHFGNNASDEYKCRSVSGLGACFATVPNGAVVACSQYEAVDTVNVGGNSAAGRTGQWWCDNHFGGNLGGSWDCRSVSAASCGAVTPNNATVKCGRYTAVNTAPFNQKSCSDPEVRGAEVDFCRLTEYMTTRNVSNVYLYNDYVRIGLNRSFGGAIMELYGVDKKNRIEEHGGASVQLSIWGYDQNSSNSSFYAKGCTATPYNTEAACEAANGAGTCRRWPNGAHVNNCTTVTSCTSWAAASPWNPIQAQAAGCGWNGHTNDISSIVGVGNGVKMTKTNPYHFTKTSSFNGMTWSVNARVPDGAPYARLKYAMSYQGPAVGVHNQEIPAIFADTSISKWFYFYDGEAPYTNARSNVTRSSERGLVQLPNRTGEATRPDPGNPVGEEWVSVCNDAETQCLTVATFAPEAKSIAHDGQYLTVLGRFELGASYNNDWIVYLFPYRFDQVVEGKSVREWIYDLKP